MFRCLCLTAVVVLALAAPLQAGGITGQYIEARTCEVFTGPCFANADTSLTGKHAVLGWKIDKGSLDNVQLDGLGVVAVVAAADTLGLKQTAPAKAILIVDNKANAQQREAERFRDRNRVFVSALMRMQLWSYLTGGLPTLVW